jgi:hypothetical protein
MILSTKASELIHLTKYCLNKPATSLNNGLLIFSIDVDVGCEQLGVINAGSNDRNVHNFVSERKVGQTEEEALPLFIQSFDQYAVPATFAMRGQLAEINGLPEALLNSPTKHEIGAHGYYHKAFVNLSREEAIDELTLVAKSMKNYNIKPVSFIYPRNLIAHLNLLEKFGYSCFRSRGGYKLDSMCIEKKGSLYDIHPSVYIDDHSGLFFLKNILKVAISKKSPLHIWFHLWNFGFDISAIQKFITTTFTPFLKFAEEKRAEGVLEFATMSSAKEKFLVRG